MIRDNFRVLVVDLGTGRGNVVMLDGRDALPAAADLRLSYSTSTAIRTDRGMIPISRSSSPSVLLPAISRS